MKDPMSNFTLLDYLNKYDYLTHKLTNEVLSWAQTYEPGDIKDDTVQIKPLQPLKAIAGDLREFAKPADRNRSVFLEELVKGGCNIAGGVVGFVVALAIMVVSLKHLNLRDSKAGGLFMLEAATTIIRGMCQAQLAIPKAVSRQLIVPMVQSASALFSVARSKMDSSPTAKITDLLVRSGPVPA